MMTVEERIEALVKKQEQAKEVFVKCQGAIEILTEMLAEKENSNKKQVNKGGKK
jgi:hypothetical protein